MFSDLLTVGTSKWGRSRSVSAENPRGLAGQGGRRLDGTGAVAARKLGRGWKVSPAVTVPAGTVHELAAVAGPGIIRHIWITSSGSFRQSVLRFYWDGASVPAIECPLGDFFCSAWSRYSPIASLPVTVVPYCGLNCYWDMPFKHDVRITLENIGVEDVVVTYQIDYSDVDVPDDFGYLHARWRRESPVNESSMYTVLDCRGCTLARTSRSESIIPAGGEKGSSSSSSMTTMSSPQFAAPAWRITFVALMISTYQGPGTRPSRRLLSV